MHNPFDAKQIEELDSDIQKVIEKISLKTNLPLDKVQEVLKVNFDIYSEEYFNSLNIK
jgi:hypothetical protein